jgi:hypothetical protein
MGVHQLLPFLTAFLSHVMFYAAKFFSKILPVQRSAMEFVSKHAIDVALLNPVISPTVDFFGIDGSVLIHACLRRSCMTDIIVNGDYTSFSAEMRTILTRLQLQIGY